MKNIVILLILITGIFTEGFSDLNPRIRKTIEKEIKKIWKDIDVRKISMKIDTKTASILQIDAGKNFILTDGKDTLGYLFVRRTNGCIIGGCSKSNEYIAPKETFGARYEYFDYMLILNKDLSVKKVKILVYDGEYGYEVGSKLWLKQFIGYSGGSLTYGKDIQAISGATVSAQSITDDIQLMHEIAKELKARGII